MIFKRVLPLVLAAFAGLVSGMYIRLGFEIVKGRPFSPGGEALVLPLVALLLYLGYSIGKVAATQRAADAAYKAGYQDGYQRGCIGRRKVEAGPAEPARAVNEYMGP